MSTYAKYAEMYKQRLAHSQDARVSLSTYNLKLNERVSPLRSSVKAAATGTSFNSTLPTFKNHSNGAIPQLPTAERNTYMTFLEVQLERVT
jgi:hypothetical protein